MVYRYRDRCRGSDGAGKRNSRKGALTLRGERRVRDPFGLSLLT
jgi:hypothetical protein